MKPLTPAQFASARARIPLWRRRGNVIRRTFLFADFKAALRFVNAVGRAAESQEHHPDIDIRWNRVRLALTTHDAGGLTRRDVDLAERCDRLNSASTR